MGEIVNLRTRRRQRDRLDRAEQAAGNRARFGRTGMEKERDRMERAQADRVLDGARLETPGADAAPGSAGESDPPGE